MKGTHQMLSQAHGR